MVVGIAALLAKIRGLSRESVMRAQP